MTVDGAMKAEDVEARIDAAVERRAALLDRGDLDAVRLVNGPGDRMPGVFVDRLGPFLLMQVEESAPFGPLLKRLLEKIAPHAIFRRLLVKNPRARRPNELAPELVFATASTAAPGEVVVHEHDLSFILRLREGYSPGLFLDQRDNRARIGEIVKQKLARAPQAGCQVLNTFAYTCAFSVAAAKAGATTTSVDLSAHYLDWGKSNFVANGLDPAKQALVRGEALTFLEIAAKKQRRFDVIVMDPPTFATNRQRGVFQVEREYGHMFELAARAAAPGAAILCSHNQRTFTRTALQARIQEGARTAKRTLVSLEPFHPPHDFPGRDPENPAARGFWAILDGSE